MDIRLNIISFNILVCTPAIPQQNLLNSTSNMFEDYVQGVIGFAPATSNSPATAEERKALQRSLGGTTGVRNTDIRIAHCTCNRTLNAIGHVRYVFGKLKINPGTLA